MECNVAGRGWTWLVKWLHRRPPDTFQGITRILRYGLPNISWKIDAAGSIEQTALVRSGQEMRLQRLVLMVTEEITV